MSRWLPDLPDSRYFRVLFRLSGGLRRSWAFGDALGGFVELGEDLLRILVGCGACYGKSLFVAGLLDGCGWHGFGWSEDLAACDPGEGEPVVVVVGVAAPSGVLDLAGGVAGLEGLAGFQVAEPHEKPPFRRIALSWGKSRMLTGG